jgi:hypothetical protein
VKKIFHIYHSKLELNKLLSQCLISRFIEFLLMIEMVQIVMIKYADNIFKEVCIFEILKISLTTKAIDICLLR